MFYFHWDGKGGKLTAMVSKTLYKLQFYLQKGIIRIVSLGFYFIFFYLLQTWFSVAEQSE